jgi:MOSC domain-containing protein YiiM
MPKQSIDIGKLIENYGLEDDIHAGSEYRQVSLLIKNNTKNIGILKEEGLCTRKFFENITVEENENLPYNVGLKIKINNVVLEIIQVGKECYSECPIYNRLVNCELSTNVIFAKVVSGGLIRVRDETEIESITQTNLSG